MRRARLLSQDRLQLPDIDRVLLRLLPTMPPTNWPRSATPHAPPILRSLLEPSAPVVVAGR